MSKARPSAGSRGRAITSDEAELWEQATRTLERVKAKPRVNAGSPAAAAPTASQVDMPPRREAHLPQPSKRVGSTAAAPSQKAGAPLDVLDRRQARRIVAGKTDIEDRIDLHGLRQAEAHRRLRAFLHGAYAKGLKTVLVITGKGVAHDRLDPFAGAMGERQRGILRRSVPLWLAEPDLSPIVLSYGAAGTRHGGAGAFYVRLRK
jgi:DNA-nicking Smr family endonuclease